jgi:ribonucleoside-diphosphate reductase alpha chain
VNKSNEILSDITVFSKYAKYIPDFNRRESWHELVSRNKEMHQRKYPKLHEEIEDAYSFVYEKKALPSMRSLQFGGAPIELAPNRIYNCAYLPAEDIESFSETMFLLLGGTGVGYSVQRHHVRKLPEITGPKKRKRRFLISDNIEGWADAIKVIMESYFNGLMDVEFDFRDIRPKGARLITTGGKAPGPQPLKDCLHNLRSILDTAIGRKLSTLEVHDMMCYIADAVLTGGIRRAAMISLFSMDDNSMLGCKAGNWWEENPQRGRSNNSAVMLRHKITAGEFQNLWKRVELSGSGEPGVYFSTIKIGGPTRAAR